MATVIRLPADLHADLVTCAHFEGRSMNEIITELVRAYLDERRPAVAAEMTRQVRERWGPALDELAQT